MSIDNDTGPEADNTEEAIEAVTNLAHAMLRMMAIHAEFSGMSVFNQGRALRHAMAHHLIDHVKREGWDSMGASVAKHAREMTADVEPVKDEIGACAGSA